MKERINSLNFLIQIDKFKGFYINEEWVKLNGELDNPNIFKSELEIYTKILNFIKAHHLEKDINLDKWTWDEINKFIIWIRAIDEGIPIRVENFKTISIRIYKKSKTYVFLFLLNVKRMEKYLLKVYGIVILMASICL